MADDENKQAGLLDELPLYNASDLSPRVIKRVVFGPGQFWDDWVMRYFILPPGESIPPHRHDWDHLVIGLRGHGHLVVEGKTWDLPPQSWGHVPANAEHVFANAGDEDFAFLCIVPTRGDPHMKMKAMRMERTRRKEGQKNAELDR